MRVVPEEVYTVREVAALTGFSRQTITRLFENERGVVILERPERMHKRGYRSIRIPRAVYERVLRRVMVNGPDKPSATIAYTPVFDSRSNSGQDITA